MRDPIALLAATLLTALLGCEREPPPTVAPSPTAPAEAPSPDASASPIVPAPEAPAEHSLTPSEPALEPAPAEPPPRSAPLRSWTRKAADYSLSAKDREALAFTAKEAEVQALFAAAEVTWPPRQLLLRAFKEEMELEVWAAGADAEPLAHVVTYRICAASGELGPKRREGDGQVPEGFYVVDFVKPRSDYYLAFHVNYPNRRDRALRSTGSSIMIHGSCVSIGCLAMSDERIQELWVMARSLPKSRQPQVHLFPRRDLDGLIAATTDEALKIFWGDLAEGRRRFEADHRLPTISSDRDGRYLFE